MEETINKTEIKEKITAELAALKQEEELLNKEQKSAYSLGLSTHSHHLTNHNLRQMRSKIVKLEYLLSMVDKPGFGKCIMCNSPLTTDRLLNFPESSKCKKCS